jgi:hypothetical protein
MSWLPRSSTALRNRERCPRSSTLLRVRRVTRLITHFGGRIALACTVAVVALIVADVILRQFRLAPAQIRPTPRFTVLRTDDPRVTRYKRDVFFAGSIIGDLALMAGSSETAVPRRVVFETDCHGFRNRELPDDTPVDVIVLGDSFAAGASGTQDDMFSNRLAEDLGIPVLNLAVGGSGPWHQYMTLTLEMPRISTTPGTRVVWVLFEGNDLNDGYGTNDQPQTSTFRVQFYAWRRNLITHSPILSLARRNHTARSLVVSARTRSGDARALFFKPYVLRAQRSKEDVIHHANAQRLKSLLHDAQRFCSARDLELSVVTVPSKASLLGPEYGLWGSLSDSRPGPPAFSLVVGSWCQELGIPWFDLWSALFDAVPGHGSDPIGVFWPDDTHWSPTGQEVSAAAIAAWFDQEEGESGSAQSPVFE